MEVKEFISHYTKKIISEIKATADEADDEGFYRIRSGNIPNDVREILKGIVVKKPEQVLKSLGVLDYQDKTDGRASSSVYAFLESVLKNPVMGEAFDEIKKTGNVVTVKLSYIDDENTAISPHRAPRYIKAALLAGSLRKKVKFESTDIVALYAKKEVNEEGNKILKDCEIRILTKYRL